MILVFGKTGQLARELNRMDGVMCLGRDDADLTDAAQCITAIREHAPRTVINAAAYTAVDAAEADEEQATRVNADTPAAMARTCAELGIPFVSVSTDYVFDGSGSTARNPDASTAPLNAYGRSKLAGERAIMATGGINAILRTSWVVSAHGRNFVTTMLGLGRDRDALTIVADQIGAPTPAKALAGACHRVATTLIDRPETAGIYHFSGTPDTSWSDFAREIFRQSGLTCAVTDIETSDYPTPARRPLNSRLDCSAFTAVFGLAPPDWRAGLTDILTDLGEI